MDEKQRKQVMAGVAGVAGVAALVLLYLNFFAKPAPVLTPEVETAAQQVVADMNKAEAEAGSQEKSAEPEVDSTQSDESSEVIYGRRRRAR